MSMKMPKGKYMATVKVGEKGQIVIPKGARRHASAYGGRETGHRHRAE